MKAFKQVHTIPNPVLMHNMILCKYFKAIALHKHGDKSIYEEATV